MYAADLDLTTDAYGHAQAADGYTQAEDLSGKNKAGIALTALRFGLLGLVKVAQHGNDMDEEAEQVASKYESVSADQAEYVMRKVAGSFAIDDDPAELARTADDILSSTTSHGYTGNQVTFLLDYCVDKGMSVDDAVAHITAKGAADVLSATYGEVGQNIIYEAVDDASSIGSEHDAQAFAKQVNDQLIADGSRYTPNDIATIIKDIGGADDVTTRSGELIQAYRTLAETSAQTGASLEQGVDVMEAIDSAEDYTGGSVISVANGTARLLTTAKQHDIAFDDIASTIKDIDRASDYSEHADDLISGSIKLLDARGRYGVSHEDAIGLIKELDRGSDYSEHASNLVTSAIRIMDASHKSEVPYNDAIGFVKALDRASDVSEHAIDLAGNAANLVEGCNAYGISTDDAAALAKALDRASDSSVNAGDIADNVVKLMEPMTQHKLSLAKMTELMKDVDRDNSGYDAYEVVDEMIRRMK